MADVKVKYIGDTTSLDAATARTTKNLDKLGKQTQQTNTHLTKSTKAAADAAKGFTGLNLGAGLATAGIGAAAIGLKAMIDQATESEKVTKQTEAVLRSTGGAAHVSADAIENLANKISEKSGIDDEAIQSGENLLLTFTKVQNQVGKGNDIFNQGVQAATDLSVAMGQDLNKSVIQVGKALNDPIKGMTALRRVGVSFTQQQQDQVKALVATGDTLSAQKVILKELTTEFGGSAAAQATAIDKLKVSVNNLAEAGGKLVLPSFESGAADSTKLIGAFESIITKTNETAKSSGFLGKAFGAVRDSALRAVPGLNGYLTVHNILNATTKDATENAGAAADKIKVYDDAIRKLADDTAGGAGQRQLAEDQKAVTAAAGDQTKITGALNTAIGAATKTTDAKTAADKKAKEATKELNKALTDLGTEAGPAAVALAKALHFPIAAIKEETAAVKDMKDANAKAFDVAGDAVDKFKDKAKVSFKEFAADMFKSLVATSNWATNLDTLADRGLNQGLLTRLRDAGPASAGEVQAILDNVGKGSIGILNNIERASKEAETKHDQHIAGIITKTTAFGRFIENFNPTLHVGISIPSAVSFHPSAGRTGGNVPTVGFETDIGRTVTVRAAGGPLAAGQASIVGEKGPELFVPKSSGTVIPNGAPLGSTFNLHNTIVVSEVDTGDRMVRKFIQAIGLGQGKADLRRALGV